jgi:hypothetical protein
MDQDYLKSHHSDIFFIGCREPLTQTINHSKQQGLLPERLPIHIHYREICNQRETKKGQAEDITTPTLTMANNVVQRCQ